MYRHVPLTVNGRTIDFYDFINHPRTDTRVAGLAQYFARMPAQHLAGLYPIFIIEHKPHRASGGGTWKPNEVSRFMRFERDTTVPATDVQSLVADYGTGLIGIPRERWDRESRYHFTVMHEVAHCVDFTLDLVHNGATENDFRGVRPTCGALRVHRFVSEAYARYILNPDTICRDAVPNESRAACNQRVIEHLRRSPAFRAVPANWSPE